MFLNPEEYDHATALLDHKIQPDNILRELRAWAQERLDITILDYCCSSFISGGTVRNTLKIIVWDEKEERKFRTGTGSLGEGYNPQVQTAFQKQFSFLCQKYGRYPEYLPPADFLVTCDTLEDEIRTKMIQTAEQEMIAAIQSSDIWKIIPDFGVIIIFYHTNEQVERYEADGNNDRIRKIILEIIKKLDRYGVFEDGILCRFDSKQTVDEIYDGSLRWYFNDN